jgi:hypothetical protein
MEAQNKDDFKMFEHIEERPSLFDGFSKTSWISTSVYRGIWRLLIFAITIGLAIDAFSNFLQKGFLFEMELYYKLIDNLEYLAIHWLILYTYAHTAFLLQLLLVKGLPLFMLIILQHLTQGSIFVLAIYVSYKTDWVPTHYLFVGVLTTTCFFKMHAYTSTNIHFYREYKAGKYKDYPSIISYQRFLHFMVLPTFIYQINYPKTTHKKSMLFIFQKLILAALLIIKVYHITTENMLPVIYEYKNYRFMSFYLRMVIPISVTYLISIFIAFDLILNTVAEITGFADRQFYEVLFLNRITGTLLM